MIYGNNWKAADESDVVGGVMQTLIEDFVKNLLFFVFAKIAAFNCQRFLQKNSILDLCQGSKYFSSMLIKTHLKVLLSWKGHLGF